MKVKFYLCITSVLNGAQRPLLGSGRFRPDEGSSGVLGIGHCLHTVFVLCKITPILIRREHRMSSQWPFTVLTEILGVDKKNQLDVTFLCFISLLIAAQHVSGNHVPIVRS